uniref:Uncharacterized protein n=1 Tax=Lotharella globosa TaxID=91324 RepID=A0A7S3ZC40_9EUKA
MNLFALFDLGCCSEIEISMYIQELERPREQNAALVSHRNLQQRIHLHQQIKLENARLQDENFGLRQKLEQLLVKYRVGVIDKENTPAKPKARSVCSTWTAKDLTKGILSARKHA